MFQIAIYPTLFTYKTNISNETRIDVLLGFYTNKNKTSLNF